METLKANIKKAIETSKSIYGITATILEPYKTDDKSIEAKIAFQFSEGLQNWAYARERMVQELNSLISTAQRDIESIKANHGINTKWVSSDKYNELVSECIGIQNKIISMNYLIGSDDLQEVFAKIGNLNYR
jgi:hypothetical protein